jgi:hypothetical protein
MTVLKAGVRLLVLRLRCLDQLRYQDLLMCWVVGLLEPQALVQSLVAQVQPYPALKALTFFALPLLAQWALPQGSWQVGLQVM